MKLIVFTLFFLITCKGQHKNEYIKNDIDSIELLKISFHDVSTASPINEEEELLIIYEIKQDSIFKKQKIYNSQNLIQTKTINSKAINNQGTFLKIPAKYIHQPEKFYFLNYIPENDGNYMNVKLLLNNEIEKEWNLSYNYTYPDDFVNIIELLEDSKNSLNTP